MSIKIALAGNPNCGKTTLFNALTGSNQFVGNWPGVTVEKKEGKVKSKKAKGSANARGSFPVYGKNKVRIPWGDFECFRFAPIK